MGKVDGQRLHWFVGKKGALITVGGRVTKTVGFPSNLIKTEYINEDPLGNIVNLKERAEINDKLFNRVVDMAPPDRYGVTIASTFELEGREEIEILDLRFDTLRFIERCRAQELDWNFENRYWVGRSDGVIWRSVQHIHPELPEFELDVLKPYAAG